MPGATCWWLFVLYIPHLSVSVSVYRLANHLFVHYRSPFIRFRDRCFMFLPTDSLPSHKSTSDSLGWGGVGWDNKVIGISTWSWCYALWSSLAFPHDLDATLYDLQLQFHTSASDSLGWGGVGWDNNLIGISTWSWCYALWSSLAFPHDLDATLYDLHWHFHMILMLRSMIFNCISTWSWCYALWSSLAFPHEPDATLYDLQLQFHMILMLRSMIFIGISTWSWCYALWSSIAIPHIRIR